MKRIALLLLAFLSLFMLSCNQAELQRIAELESRVDSLTVQSEQKDATINEFFESLNQIEENLKLITSKEQQITTEVKNGGEIVRSQKMGAHALQGILLISTA